MKKLLLSFLSIFLTLSLACGSGFLIAKYTAPQASQSEQEQDSPENEVATPTASGNWADYVSTGSFTWQYSDRLRTVYISTATELARFSYNVNKGTVYMSNNDGSKTYFYNINVVLRANIDLSAHYWKPIGVGSKVYTGDFDGAGYTVSGIYVNSLYYSGGYYLGLFGDVNSTIKNLNIDNMNLAFTSTAASFSTGSLYMGVVAYNRGTISNVTTKNSEVRYTIEKDCNANVGSVYMGGIVGYGGTILNCSNGADVIMGARQSTGNPNSSWYYLGGVSGANSTVKNCENNGEVLFSHARSAFDNSRVVDGLYVGGVIGSTSSASYELFGNFNYGEISISGELFAREDYVFKLGGIAGRTYNIGNCHNFSKIWIFDCAEEFRVGGVVGVFQGATLSSCTNFGELHIGCDNDWEGSGYGAYGGIAGTNSGTVTNCANYGTIYGSYTTNISLYNVGGIVGFGGSVTKCLNLGYINMGIKTQYVGAISGYTTGTITNCVNMGKMKYTGGSYFEQTIGSCNQPVGTVTNCYGRNDINHNSRGTVLGYTALANKANEIFGATTIYDSSTTSTAWFTSYVIYEYFSDSLSDMGILQKVQIPVPMVLVGKGTVAVKLMSLKTGSWRTYMSEEDSASGRSVHGYIDYMDKIGYVYSPNDNNPKTFKDFYFLQGGTKDIHVFMSTNVAGLTFGLYSVDYYSVYDTSFASSKIDSSTGAHYVAARTRSSVYESNYSIFEWSAVFFEYGKDPSTAKINKFKVDENDVATKTNEGVVSFISTAKIFINSSTDVVVSVTPPENYNFEKIIVGDQIYENFKFGTVASFEFVYDGVSSIDVYFKVPSYDINLKSVRTEGSSKTVSWSSMTQSASIEISTNLTNNSFSMRKGYLYTLKYECTTDCLGGDGCTCVIFAQTYYDPNVDGIYSFSVASIVNGLNSEIARAIQEFNEQGSGVVTVGGILINSEDRDIGINLKLVETAPVANINAVAKFNTVSDLDNFNVTSQEHFSIKKAPKLTNTTPLSSLSMTSGSLQFDLKSLFGYENIAGGYTFKNVTNPTSLMSSDFVVVNDSTFTFAQLIDVYENYYKSVDSTISTNEFFDMIYGTNYSGQNPTATGISLYTYFKLLQYDFEGRVLKDGVEVPATEFSISVRAVEDSRTVTKSFGGARIYYNAPVTISISYADNCVFNGVWGGAYTKGGTVANNALSADSTYNFTNSTSGGKNAVYIELKVLTCDVDGETPIFLDGVYEIESAKNLVWLERQVVEGADFSQVVFRQTKNIDMSGTNIKPIGTSSNPFNGVYDGCGYMINNFGATSTFGELTSYNALFAQTKNATIKNLNLQGGMVSGAAYVSSLVAKAENTIFENVNNKNNIQTTIITITNIYGATIASNENAYFGGLVAYAKNCKFVACSNRGNVTTDATVSYSGGLVGFADANTSLYLCFNEGNVGETTAALANATHSKVIDCYSRCNIGSAYQFRLYNASGTSGVVDGVQTGSVDLIIQGLDGEIWFANYGVICLKAFYWA